jgi:hypothetical protein
MSRRSPGRVCTTVADRLTDGQIEALRSQAAGFERELASDRRRRASAMYEAARVTVLAKQEGPGLPHPGPSTTVNRDLDGLSGCNTDCA